MIANDVVAGLQEKDCFEMAEAVKSGIYQSESKTILCSSISQ